MDIWRSIKKNLGTFVAFQMLYVAFGSALLGLLTYLTFSAAVQVSVGYIAAHTLKPFLMHPASWLAAAIVLVLLAFFSLFSIIVVVYLNEAGRQDKHVGLREVIIFSAKASARAVRPKNWKIILLVVLILPVLNVGILPIVGDVVIPDFIMEYISYYWYLTVAFVVAVCLLVVLMMRWKFAINVMAIERLPFKDAMVRSVQIGKGHHVSDFLRLIICQVAVFLAAIACLVVGIAGAVVLGHAAADAQGAMKVFLGLLSGIVAVGGAGVAATTWLLNVPVCYSCLSGLYYRRSEQAGFSVPKVELGERQAGRGRVAKFIIAGVLSGLMVLGSSVLIVDAFDGTLRDYITQQDVKDVLGEHKVGVVAHRCGAHFAPENTVAALNKAADMGATWCELDAQQLADGTIIVMHDTNFARTTGFNKNSWEATWNEVEPLDAGSFYSADYAGEKIPLLDQIIKAAKARDVKLQIEVKPTGNEANLETAVIDIIKQNDFQNDCVFASQNYDSLKIAREYDPTIRTLYITSVAFGDILKADAADDFSIEATWVTQDVVDLLHGADRKVFAWTVNSAEIMERLISLDIDALVTDEVELAITESRESSSGSLSENVIEFLGL